MAKKKKIKKNELLPSCAETFKSIRQTWGMSPVTKIKGNVKKSNSKTACRKSKKKED